MTAKWKAGRCHMDRVWQPYSATRQRNSNRLFKMGPKRGRLFHSNDLYTTYRLRQRSSLYPCTCRSLSATFRPSKTTGLSWLFINLTFYHLGSYSRQLSTISPTQYFGTLPYQLFTLRLYLHQHGSHTTISVPKLPPQRLLHHLNSTSPLCATTLACIALPRAHTATARNFDSLPTRQINTSDIQYIDFRAVTFALALQLQLQWHSLIYQITRSALTLQDRLSLYKLCFKYANSAPAAQSWIPLHKLSIYCTNSTFALHCHLILSVGSRYTALDPTQHLRLL